jgi:hypothetical protein
MIRNFFILALYLTPFALSWAADEASPGGARQALNRADALAKTLGSDDPVDVRNAMKEAVQIVPAMERIASLLSSAAERIVAIRMEFEKKAVQGKSAAATAFYEAELKIMKGREADLSELHTKLTSSVAQLKEKIEKAKSNPEVQALLRDDELLQRAKDALEKLKSLKLPSLDP